MLACMALSAEAVPKGKYCADDGSSVEVSNVHIFLFIGNYRAGSFSILQENEDGTFTFSDEGGQIHKGRWYEQDGRIYLILGGRTLVKCD